MERIAAIMTCMVTISACVVGVWENIKKLRKMRNLTTIIGIPAGVDLPDEVKALPDYTNYSKAVNAGQPVVLLHCRSLSRCLRLCDFVIYKGSCDEKIIDVSTPEGIKTLVAIID